MRGGSSVSRSCNWSRQPTTSIVQVLLLTVKATRQQGAAPQQRLDSLESMPAGGPASACRGAFRRCLSEPLRERRGARTRQSRRHSLHLRFEELGAGTRAADLESTTLDCKQEAGRCRGGSHGPGSTHNDAAAHALVGASHGAEWLREKIWEQTEPHLGVEIQEHHEPTPKAGPPRTPSDPAQDLRKLPPTGRARRPASA